jgi:peptidoglycan/LPS O-acetylase OafA/YrhL
VSSPEPPNARRAPFRHLPFLDGLRAIAILLVMVFHLRQHVLTGGFLGVDVFFVLSGFLITGLLVQEWTQTGSVSLGRFYLRRVLRLIPALVVLLAVWTFYARSVASTDWGKILKVLGVVLFYVSNWFQAYETGLIDFRNSTRPILHTWSLAIEEQFYLVWPVGLILLLRSGLPRRILVSLVLAGASLCALWRALLFGALGPRHWARVFYGSDARADVILMGCALGLLYSWDALPKSPRGLTALRVGAGAALVPMTLMLLWATTLSPLLYRGGLSLFGLGVAAQMAVLLQGPPRLAKTLLESRVLVWIGRRSYGLYLWHWFLYKVVDSDSWSNRERILVRLVGSFAVAGVSYAFVERPFLNWKARLRPPGEKTRHEDLEPGRAESPG